MATSALNSRPMTDTAASIAWSWVRMLDRSRAASNKARERTSRCVATLAWKRSPAVSWPVTRPTTSITAKVSRYCTSDTANDNCGGTKKKSNAATFRNAAITDGPRPCHTATPTTDSRNTITMLARSKYGTSPCVNTVVAAQAAAARP